MLWFLINQVRRCLSLTFHRPVTDLPPPSHCLFLASPCPLALPCPLTVFPCFSQSFHCPRTVFPCFSQSFHCPLTVFPCFSQLPSTALSLSLPDLSLPSHCPCPALSQSFPNLSLAFHTDRPPPFSLTIHCLIHCAGRLGHRRRGGDRLQPAWPQPRDQPQPVPIRRAPQPKR